MTLKSDLDTDLVNRRVQGIFFEELGQSLGHFLHNLISYPCQHGLNFEPKLSFSRSNHKNDSQGEFLDF